VDIVAALTDSENPRDYWYRMKRREAEATGFELSTLCRQLKIPAADGKLYETEVVNTESAFRIIQSIPSPKAEPFKLWLAQVGYERVQEIENPELAQQRMRELYKQKGYPADWIEKRVRSIAIRDELTGEWKSRGVNEGVEFAILTSEISKATFGLTPAEYKNLKGLKRENLRDHMTDLELIFTMLGEAATTEIARNKGAAGFNENKKAAKEGGIIAGSARRQLEVKSGKPVVTTQNYLSAAPHPALMESAPDKSKKKLPRRKI
jgi:DNA-damage-inducible protein D